MPPKKPGLSEFELFRMLLTNMINMSHPLVKVANEIDWTRFDAAWGKFYHEKKGRPGLPTRLMAGLHLLKHMHGLSDEEVCARWVENPYWQYFCGEEYFRLSLVFDRSSMTRWRGRIGPDELELMLAETLRVAMASGALSPQACERITVDTTVQTKAVAHPTDAHLLLRAMEHVCRLARKHGLKLRQSFLRLGREARREVARLIHGKGHKQALRHLRKMRTWLGRLTRDVGRKIEALGEDGADIAQAFAETLELAEKVRTQQAKDKNKVYALHAPEVECISKGKARKPYEFGVKVSLAVTHKRGLMVGARSFPGNPFDGHILSAQLEQTTNLMQDLGRRPTQAIVDLGYRGVDADNSGVQIIHRGKYKSLTKQQRRWLKRRQAIEPAIGHAKSDHRMDRCWLQGALGDALHAISCAAGYNLRWLLRAIPALRGAADPMPVPV